MVRLRLGDAVDRDNARRLVEGAVAHCASVTARLLLDRQTIEFGEGRCGLHLDSRALLQIRHRPDDIPFVSASCHDRRELEHACAIGVDWVVVSPVLPTASHPGAVTLGWEGLKRLAAVSTVPVYALGGMQRSHLEQARRVGAAGIAAIRGLWLGE